MKRSGLNTASALGRPLDPKYPTNLIIMALTPIAGVVAGILFLLNGSDLWGATQAGFYTGAATFLAWALAREIDIDHDWSAFVSVGIVWVALYIWKVPTLGLISLATLLLLSRFVSRIVGLTPTLPETVVVLVVASGLFFFGNWIFVLVCAVGFFFDGTLSNPVRHHIFVALGLVVALGIRIATMGFGELGGADLLTNIGMWLIVIAFLATILATRKMKSDTDIRKYKLDVRRVRAVMLFGLLSALIPAIWNGEQGILWMLPLWTTLISTVLYRIPVTIKEWQRFQKKRAKA